MTIFRPLALVGACVTSISAQETLVTPAARPADSILVAAEARGFSGVALFAKDGAPVLRKAYGLAQREAGTRFTPATVVQIGSNTKDLTAVAILQLMQRGKLRLEDSVAKFFPAAPADRRHVTLLQLLRHRSGLPIGIAPDPERVTRPEFLERVMRVSLGFRPGEREQYSNAGYSLLAAIIEQLAGTSYDIYVRDNILAPLGMKETGYLLPNFPRERLAHGYSAAGDKGTVLDLPHLPDGPSWTLRGNGGMLSTVSDMASFYAALFGTERLLSAAARSRLFDPREAMVLAGSDLTSYFVFQREPQARLDLFLASTSTDVRAPELLRRVAQTFGLGAGEQVMAAANAPEISLPATNVARAAREYLEMVNGADSAAALRYFTDRVLPAPSAPPPAVRYERLQGMRAELGRLVPIAYREPTAHSAELSARGSNGDVAVILIEIEDAAPFRVRSLRVRVGG